MAKELIIRRRPTKQEVIDLVASHGDAEWCLAVYAMPAFTGSEERTVFDAIVAHLRRGVSCRHCQGPIQRRRDAVRDHIISLRRLPAHMRAAYDMPWNWRYLCLECNRLKTYGRGLGAVADGDATVHAKLRRLEQRREGEPRTWKSRLPSRPLPKPSQKKAWAKGRKIPVRPFPTGQRRFGA